MTEAPEPQAWKHAINGRGRQQAAKSPTDWRKLEAPFYYAANVQILISGNDATLLFTRPHPVVLADGTVSPTPLREPVAMIAMSVAALKELSRSAGDVMRQIEQRSGETPTNSPWSGDPKLEAAPNSAGATTAPLLKDRPNFKVWSWKSRLIAIFNRRERTQI